MSIRPLYVGFLALLTAVLAGGCKKSASDEKTPAPQAVQKPAEPAAQNVARIHWLGKKRLASEPSATNFMAIWNLPESARLEAQTLDKLAQAPWRLRPGNTNFALTNAAAALLRPLLDDLVQEESYLEIATLTNQPPQVALAIRLDSARAALWETNIGEVLEAITGQKPTVARNIGGRTFTLPKLSRGLSLSRKSEWTVLGLGLDDKALSTFSARLISDSHVSPLASPGTNYWLEAAIDLQRLADRLGWRLKPGLELPNTDVIVFGEDSLVRTRAQLNFPHELKIEMQPWNIPTNLIQGPLVSFTAVRGIRPWLEFLKAWNIFQSAPNQLYFWSCAGIPFLSYCAAELEGASNAVAQLPGHFVDQANVWLSTNGMGNIARATNAVGFAWNNIPYMAPHLEARETIGGDFLVGGLFPTGPAKQSMPADLLTELMNRTNLVYYEGEMTGAHSEALVHIDQLLRIIFHRLQLPAKSAGAEWLKATESKLGMTIGMVTCNGPQQLSFGRKSSVGLTAVELHLLADWLESPTFPVGVHTLVAEPPPKKNKPAGMQPPSGPTPGP